MPVDHVHLTTEQMSVCILQAISKEIKYLSYVTHFISHVTYERQNNMFSIPRVESTIARSRFTKDKVAIITNMVAISQSWNLVILEY